jgi:VanZ family protein
LHRVPFPLAGCGEDTTILPVRDSRWLPVVAWAALIFALSGIPSLGTGLGVWDEILRSGAHVVEYAVLGALLSRALAAAPSLAAGIAYAVTDELHQSLVPGRGASFLDLGLDSVGVVAGVILWARR